MLLHNTSIVILIAFRHDAGGLFYAFPKIIRNSLCQVAQSHYICSGNKNTNSTAMTEKSKYVRFDWAIKRILRDKANKEVLEGLITVLLGEPVTITEILESEGNQDAREDKTNRVDVKAKTSQGEYIIVEVQLTKEGDFFQRILFGTAKSITDQIGTGQDYNVIKKIYSINIMYFDFGSGEDYAYHGVTEFTGMTKKDAVLLPKSENEEKYIGKKIKPVTMPGEVFPEFFLLIVDKFNEVARTPIEEWMQYLKDAVIRDDTNVPGLQAAREKLAYMSMTDKDRRAYEDYMISVHAAKDAYDTARSDGYKDGWHEGRAEGLEKGREAANLANARKMKELGMATEVIVRVTGLTTEQIEAL